MSWKTIKMGEVAVSIQPGPFGSQLHSSDYSSEGTPIIMPKDMVDGRISHADLLFVSDEHVKRLSRHQVHPGNLMVARKGDVRKCVYISENEDGWMTGSDCLKVALNEESCFPKFIYYQLRSPYIGKWLETISIGATMPSLNSGLLGSIELYLPPIEDQKRISSVLSAYDDLIETNQRQIKVLEEAARRLYKEWFVDLRYPGHDNVPVVDGVPEGWRIKTISDIARINACSVGKDYPYTEIEYIDISSVNKGQISSRTTYEMKDAPGRARRLAHDGDTIWSMVRPNLRAYSLVQYPEKNEVFSTGFAILSPKIVPFSYLYCMVTTDEFVGYLVNCTNGAAYPAVKPIHFEEAKAVIPTSDILQKYDKIATPMFRKIHQLSCENNHLAEARDRLLPKLMSGEIAV